jgi:hypothetical protein
MEPMMISLKVLSTAAVMALVLPMAVPSASFAQSPHPHAGAGARASGSFHPGGGPRMGGGAPAARFSGGGAPGARFSGGGGGGGVYRGGYAGGYRRDGGGGFIPGAVAGAVVGGALASGAYGYYGAPDYGPGYYDDQYYDGGPVAVMPDGGDDSVTYCMQTYRSYDPQSGTYLGNDGYRHPCP